MNTNTLNTQIYEEATEWIIFHRSDDLDAEAKRRFDAWLRESPQHLRAYLEMSTIWEDVPTLNRDWNPSADELIIRARAEGNVHPLALKVPGAGGAGVIGTVLETVPGAGVSGLWGLSREVPDDLPLQSLKDLKDLQALEGLEALRALSEVEESTPLAVQAAVPGTGTFGVVGTVPAAQEQVHEEEESAAAPLHAEQRFQSVPVASVPASQSMLMRVLAIAATLVLIVSSGAWYYLQRGLYSTDTGEQLTIALNDGTTVQLNSQTKLRVHYTHQDRTIVLLQGQALFKVAKDPNRPFIVDSDGTRVRAVGTQFDVYKKATGTQVTVVEGRVAVAAPTVPGAGVSSVPGLSAARSSDANADSIVDEGTPQQSTTRVPTTRPRAGNAPSVEDAAQRSSSHALQAQLGEVLVSAGEQILIAQNTPTPQLALGADDSASSPNAGTVPIPHGISRHPGESQGPVLAPAKVTAANVEAATAWTQQRLVFDITPLTEVAAEFNRYNRRPLIIDDSELATFNISGSFSSTDPALLLRFLREQPGIVVHETTDEIRISRENTHG